MESHRSGSDVRSRGGGRVVRAGCVSGGGRGRRDKLIGDNTDSSSSGTELVQRVNSRRVIMTVNSSSSDTDSGSSDNQLLCDLTNKYPS